MPKPKRWPLAALIAISTAGVYTAPEGAQAENLLIITVDTTRVDHLSCYGYSRPTSPNIDRLADEGVLFESATTQIPLTGPAHISLMTSRYPRSHGAIRNGVPMQKGIPTLAEVLSGRGYATAAFISGWTLRNKLTGLQAGFQTYDEGLKDHYWLVKTHNGPPTRSPTWPRSGSTRTATARSSCGFTILIRTTPYRKYQDYYRPPDKLKGGGKNEYGFSLEKVARYDSEISFMDYHIGRLLTKLDDAGLADSTVVVLTGDHGESFGEHDYVGHGRRVYESNLRIPMVFRHSGKLPAGTRSRYPTQTIDVMPTVLALLDTPAPEGLEGRNLGAALQGAAPDHRPRNLFRNFLRCPEKVLADLLSAAPGCPVAGREAGRLMEIYL